MAAAIDFYFDFSSPYGYLASTKIDEIAAKYGRDVMWRPFLLGPVFKISGLKPLVDVPLKSDYIRRDFDRSARLFGVPFKLPANFPFGAVAASRAYYWLSDRDLATAKRFAKAVYHAAFGDGLDVTPVDTVLDIAATLGVERDALKAALEDQAAKDRLKAEVDRAIRNGVFGSPYIVVDGEPFWGSDRLWQIEKWLETGGW